MTGPAFYATYFDQRYLARGLVMMRSLRLADPDAIIVALCLDALTFEIVAAQGDRQVVPVAHEDILAFEPALRACADRPRAAFYATHKPVLPRYILMCWPEASRVTHIDTDTYFFDSPKDVFAEAPTASILLSPHRYHPDKNWERYYGRFNAGFISWRNDETSRICLADYQAQCLDRVEPDESGGRFMNQGYLTVWPERYPNVHVLRHPGANLAPWNVQSHRLQATRVDDVHAVTVDGMALIFFHFSRMFRDTAGFWRTDYLNFGEANLAVALLKIYQPYFRAVDAQILALARAGVSAQAMELPPNLETFSYVT
ncbi:MAG: hypothetical protein IV086_09790 [Hyphomonadaceae bacterium]|nr:MAG: hypothetical protein FD160_3479 [Caulobacteraceae bacterium]MBT9445976.1 hypothetical protein [Hyphomonadaceae bacterium]TPW04636.1 MAG: hypothetical protein FD124_2524 [Alphaproteobacteria bacterium]